MSDLSYPQLRSIESLINTLEKLRLISPSLGTTIVLSSRNEATLDARQQLADEIRDMVLNFERAYN